MLGAVTEKECLTRFSFVLGIESCCEVDDLSCLGMFGRCRRPPSRPDVYMAGDFIELCLTGTCLSSCGTWVYVLYYRGWISRNMHCFHWYSPRDVDCVNSRLASAVKRSMCA